MLVTYNYLTDKEMQALQESRKNKVALDQLIAENNSSLVGEPKQYKGVVYQMRQNGLYECLNTTEASGLIGSFTSPQAIRHVVDNLERQLRKAP